MLPDDQWLKAIADALQETARLQLETHELIQHEFEILRALPRATKVHTATHRGPLNPRHQTWRGFVEDMQGLERLAVREGDKLTKGNICKRGLDSAKTITRTMAWYGLAASVWPPSGWDAAEPRLGKNARP